MGIFGLSKEEKLVEDTANQIRLVSEMFDAHLCVTVALRRREMPDFGDGYFMVLLGIALGMSQIIGRDASFAEICLRKYLSKYNDADEIIARMAHHMPISGFENIFHSSIEAYRTFHNGADPTSTYLRLADVYLDSGLP
jgi:hypothetical protein